jgi:hypothetical protein
MRYTIRRVSPYSALFYGLLIGLVAWLIPGILLGRLVAQAVTRLAAWAQSLQLEIPLPLGQNLSFDLINLLQLTESQARLAALAARDTSLIIAVALATAAAGMLLTGLITLLAALVYNLFASLARRHSSNPRPTGQAQCSSRSERKALPTAAQRGHPDSRGENT